MKDEVKTPEVDEGTPLPKPYGDETKQEDLDA